MNERIKELAKEHGFVRWDYDSLSYELKGDIEDLYAFAELLIRECIAVIGEENYAMLSGKAYCTQLKRHFGVEE